MRITESELRKIIRKELIKESMKNVRDLMSSVKSAFIAAGLTLTLPIMNATLTQIDDLNRGDDMRAATSRHYDNLTKKEKSLAGYYNGKKFKPHGPPSHHSGQEKENEGRIKKALEYLKNVEGLSEDEIEKAIEEIRARSEMYEG